MNKILLSGLLILSTGLAFADGHSSAEKTSLFMQKSPCQMVFNEHPLQQ